MHDKYLWMYNQKITSIEFGGKTFTKNDFDKTLRSLKIGDNSDIILYIAKNEKELRIWESKKNMNNQMSNHFNNMNNSHFNNVNNNLNNINMNNFNNKKEGIKKEEKKKIDITDNSVNPKPSETEINMSDIVTDSDRVLLNFVRH